MASSSSDDFSVMVLASDLGIDARPFLSHPPQPPEEDNWHDCPSYLPSADDQNLDFSDLDALQFLRLERGSDKAGNRILRVVGNTVQKEDNSPGITILRWIYEELPNDYKDRLQVVYFIHPGLRSRLVFATLGRFLLSGGLYWKIKYISRLQYLWQDIKKGEVEIPEFVKEHDDILEDRPLTDYGIEPDPLHLMEVPSTAYSLGRYEAEWASRECRS
ncbi:UNVERIFIED_CONTAM: hypothetical protein Sradi_5557300 [Sesamum radiatum]|uniref:CRAL-TRIO domain-containing protein n=1 Tax=Sesamum radiatum TaxID=300843 RepID=A0AAW2LF08_SESRA